MFWTDDHDKLMCREILAVDPFTGTKKGTVQRGAKWKEIVENLMAIHSPKFKVDARAVRDRFSLLSQKLKRKLSEEKKASGIDTEMTETEDALEEIIEKENASEEVQDCDSDRKKKSKEADKVTAEDMRKKAMERLGQSKKREGEENNEIPPKKKRSNGSDTLMYLREKNVYMQEMRKEEMDMKKKELELQEKKHDDFMKVVLAQQQSQAKQMQDFQSMMVGVLTRFAQK